MSAFLVSISLAPLFWGVLLLSMLPIMHLSLNSLWRKLFAFILFPLMMVTWGIQAQVLHVGHPHGAHATAFVFVIAVDCLPLLPVIFYLDRKQDKLIEDGQLV